MWLKSKWIIKIDKKTKEKTKKKTKIIVSASWASILSRFIYTEGILTGIMMMEMLGFTTRSVGDN